jgi:hypothetical protein
VLKTNSLPIVDETPKDSLRLSRREAARRLLAGMAASALPWGATSHPVWKHFEDEHLMHRAEAAAEGKLHFLNAEQFESLTALAEAIVPGSTKANVAGFVDLLLSAEKEKPQKEFVSSVDAIENDSRKRYAKRFPALSDTQKNELLTAASSAVKGKAGLREEFENLKEWISGAYYSSEMGMRELGWTPDRVFAEFPGCSHAEGHQ